MIWILNPTSAVEGRILLPRGRLGRVLARTFADYYDL
jgi:hypothetical protein